MHHQWIYEWSVFSSIILFICRHSGHSLLSPSHTFICRWNFSNIGTWRVDLRKYNFLLNNFFIWTRMFFERGKKWTGIVEWHKLLENNMMCKKSTNRWRHVYFHSCFSRYRAIITPLHEKMSKTTAKIIITFIWASSILVKKRKEKIYNGKTKLQLSL